MNWVKDKLLEMEEEDKGTGDCECLVCGRNFDPDKGDENSTVCPECWERKMEKD